MNAPLSPAAMIVRAGQMHDDGTHPLNPVQMRDLYAMLDILPGGEAAINAAVAELAGDPCTPIDQPATAHLAALEMGRAHEAARLARATCPHEIAHRTVWLAQYDREIAGERAFLGMAPEPAPLPPMSDAELLAELLA